MVFHWENRHQGKQLALLRRLARQLRQPPQWRLYLAATSEDTILLTL